MTTYEVPIIYTGLCNFIVEAPNSQRAREIAEAMFKNGDEPIVLGNEHQEVAQVCQPMLIITQINEELNKDSIAQRDRLITEIDADQPDREKLP